MTVAPSVLTRNQMTQIRKNESLVDDCFYVWETRYGLWSTKTKEDHQYDVGITGMTREIVVDMTRWHLKHLQEGTLDSVSYVVGDAFVGGKL